MKSDYRNYISLCTNNYLSEMITAIKYFVKCMFHCLHVSDTGMDNKPVTTIITLQIQIYNSN